MLDATPDELDEKELTVMEPTAKGLREAKAEGNDFYEQLDTMVKAL